MAVATDREYGLFIAGELTEAASGEIRELIECCKRGVRERFGVQLREEIVYLGFDPASDGRMPE